MTTLRELADAVNMNPAELREWFPWVCDPATSDNICLDAETVSEVLRSLGPALPTHLPL